MTDRLHDDELDRHIRQALAWRADDISQAPTIEEMAMRVTARSKSRTASLRVAPQLAWVMLAGLLLVAVASGVVISGMFPPTDSVRPNDTDASPAVAAAGAYEAVFVRRDPSADILVVGIDSHGRERVITRLTDAWNAGPIGRGNPAPAGVLSPSGLLAMAADVEGDGGGEVHWAILDLLHPEEEPIVIPGFPSQDIDQLDYFLVADRTTDGARPWWGPDDQLAIYWYERIPQGGNAFGRNYFMTFANGRTGEATSLDIRDDLDFLPHWAPDGSGVFIDTDRAPQLLRSDGTLVPSSDPVPEADCHQLPPDGELDARPKFGCPSPDHTLIAITSGNVSFPTGSVTVQASGEVFEVAGSFAGWLKSNE